MKKLMMAAAIVCAAAFAHAATVDWSVDYFADPDGSQAGNYGYLLIDTGSLTGWSTYSIDSAAADLANGNIAFLNTYALQNSDGVKAFEMSDYGASGLGYADNGVTKVVDNDQRGIRAYLVITDSANLDKVTKALLVDVNEYGEAVVDNIGSSGTPENGFAFGDISSYSSNPDNWQSVPEPTSGLLLLLGVAGLALRRRRA